jgi:hypothetical protein
MASPPPGTSGSAQVRRSHPLFSDPWVRLAAAVFDWRANFCHSALVETLAFRIRTPGQRLAGLRAMSYKSVTRERKSVLPVDAEAVSTAESPLFKCGPSMMGFRTAR